MIISITVSELVAVFICRFSWQFTVFTNNYMWLWEWVYIITIDNAKNYFIAVRLQGSRGEQERLLRLSTTLYVGNLSFYTTEEQIYELFSKCGDIKRIVMGLDKYKKTPCGFCFLEYPFEPHNNDVCKSYKHGSAFIVVFNILFW